MNTAPHLTDWRRPDETGDQSYRAEYQAADGTPLEVELFHAGSEKWAVWFVEREWLPGLVRTVLSVERGGEWVFVCSLEVRS